MSCLLFFPGTRPALLEKASASGARWVCVDLEDAVAPQSKPEARASAKEFLEAGDGQGRLVVRINHPSTSDGERDLDALARLDRRRGLLTVMVPKADSASDVERVRAQLSGHVGRLSVIPVVETARGLANVEQTASSEGVRALLFGGLDLSVDLGCALDWEALLYARSRCVLAARLAGIELLDTPFFDLDDPDGLRRESERARRLGFTAKAAIHPSQVDVIHEAFAPTQEEIARARRVVEGSEREGRGVFLLDGVMIDRPAVEAARRLLARSSTSADRALES